MRFKNISASLLALSLGIVSTTFVFISITSKEWSVQKYYSSNGGRGSTTTWTDPVCVAHRSPFYRCMNWPIISYDAVANTTSCSIADCSFYKPYGFDQTSCRSAVEVGDENGVTVGGFQECQQVHLAGNLQVAASVFIAFGLLLLLILTFLNFTVAIFGGESHKPDPERENLEARREGEVAELSRSEERTRSHHLRRLSHWAPVVNLLLLLSLYIGALLQFLTQISAILGLTVLATPTQLAVQSNNLGGTGRGATDWTMDKALSQYVTVAWTTALACALLSGYIYRRPRFAKLL